MPLSHDLQGLPFPVLKRPGPHAPHAVFESAPSRVPDPAGHGVQPAPESSLYLPTGHVSQVARLLAPALLPVPALQAWVHVDWPLEGLYFPGAQGWQVVLPVAVEKLP